MNFTNISLAKIINYILKGLRNELSSIQSSSAAVGTPPPITPAFQDMANFDIFKNNNQGRYSNNENDTVTLYN